MILFTTVVFPEPVPPAMPMMSINYELEVSEISRRDKHSFQRHEITKKIFFVQ